MKIRALLQMSVLSLPCKNKTCCITHFMRYKRPTKIPMQLIERLIDVTKKIGVEKTNALLYQASLCSSADDLIKVNIIKNATCFEFQIPETALHEVRNTQISSEAANVFVFLLYKYLKYSDKDIKHIYFKRYNNFYPCIERMQKLDISIKPDRELLNKIGNIELAIKKHFN